MICRVMQFILIGLALRQRIMYGAKLYEGVIGHLFGIAINVSEQRGHGGCVHAIAIVIGIMHPYHFVIEEESARKIKEIYKYEWSDEEL